MENLDTLPDGFFEALIDGEEDPFEVGDDPTAWRKKDLHTVLYEDGRAIAHVGLTLADVEIGEHRFQVTGVGGVIVNRDHRGQGRLRPLLEAALARASTDIAMLFCLPKNVPMYERFGFIRIEAPVVAGGQDMAADAVMWKPLRAEATWPDGPVNLPQLPF